MMSLVCWPTGYSDANLATSLESGWSHSDLAELQFEVLLNLIQVRRVQLDWLVHPGPVLEKLQRRRQLKKIRSEEVSQDIVSDVTRVWRAVGTEPESHLHFLLKGKFSERRRKTNKVVGVFFRYCW